MASPIVLCDTAGMSNERWLECRAHGPNTISLRLWSVPSKNIDLWLDLVSMLSGKAKPNSK